MLLVPADDDPEVADVLHRLEANTRERRRLEVADLRLVLAWADLHRMPIQPDDQVEGGEQLTPLGGEGTPRVQELALCELGIARSCHTLAARCVVADVLDLRHRLPATWAALQTMGAEVWVARKIAAMTRALSADCVGLVDGAVAAAICTQAPARVLDLAAAKIIEADQPAYEAKVAAEKARSYVALGRTDETGLRLVIARVTAGDAHWIDATITRVAEILAAHPDHPELADASTDQLRATAYGWLARPAELLQLLLQNTTENTTENAAEHAGEGPEEQSRATAFPADLLDALTRLDPARLRPKTVLYIHLHEAALTGAVAGVARVEGLGPHTLTALTELLATSSVTVKPVIDLTERLSTIAYEHPQAIKERIHLRRPGDQFPHANTTSRNLDLDHVTPYRTGGPPGQTNCTDTQPLRRTSHRAKTHLDYQCTPLPNGS
ncbi:MAG: hypothetical protein WB767_13015, partial [Nocardioides sp.]